MILHICVYSKLEITGSTPVHLFSLKLADYLECFPLRCLELYILIPSSRVSALLYSVFRNVNARQSEYEAEVSPHSPTDTPNLRLKVSQHWLHVMCTTHVLDKSNGYVSLLAGCTVMCCETPLDCDWLVFFFHSSQNFNWDLRDTSTSSVCLCSKYICI